MIRPVTYQADRPRRVRRPFVLAELLLVLAVPLLAFLGLQALLGSRAGNFIEEPGPADPGYRALVEPTPVTAVVEITDQRLTGIVVISQPGGTEPGGGAILVPAQLLVEGVPLGSLAVEEAVASLERGLHLRIPRIEVIEAAGWPSILGDSVYRFSNPDQVLGPEGDVLFPVGPVEVSGTTIGDLLGRGNEDVDPRSLLFRRQLIWDALLESPPEADLPLALLLASVGAGPHQSALIPTRSTAAGLVIDAEPAEQLVRATVPFPAGSEPGDRLRVRALDLVGEIDLQPVAEQLAGQGHEVVEIGNVGVFVTADQAVNQLIVPLGVTDVRTIRLAEVWGADILQSDEIDTDADGVVTLLVGVPVS